jgi:uncharacterized membrane protein YcfT
MVTLADARRARRLDALMAPYSLPRPAQRSVAIDRARGLAIVCMVLDHCLLIWGGSETGAASPVHVLRSTVGRIALPLFFVISGHLVRRLSWRWAGIVAIGLVLPVVAPWLDDPNVLVWYGLGAAVIVACRRYGVSLWLLPVLSLAWAANWGFSPLHVSLHSYDGLALLGLMGLGAVLDRQSFGWASRLPRLLDWPGRHPLSVYVGHVLVLNVLVLSGLSAIHVVRG